MEEGEFLVRSARKTISHYLENTETALIGHDKKFDSKMGVFVTLETHPGHNLRGCIGYPQPIMPLFRALQDAAISAAEFDPRFDAVQAGEMKDLIVEITVLTPPEKMTGRRADFPKKIKVGKHGLIVRHGPFSGLLLPQVAVEQKWDPETFLEQTCWKANLSQDMWTNKDTEILTFEGQIFSETEPNGKVIEKKH